MNAGFVAPLNAPIAEKRPHKTSFHDVDLKDDYYWLRAENWQEAMRDPQQLPDDIKRYLNAENDYYEAAMSDTSDLQNDLVAEMRGRIKEDDMSVPVKDGPFAYNWKYLEGSEHPVRVRTPREGGDEEVLLDINAEAEGHDYFEVGYVGEDPTHKFLAWSCDTSGSEYYALRFRPAGTNRDFDYMISDVGSVAWADESTLFYTRVDENHRPNKVFRHKLHTDPDTDVLVYEERDPRFLLLHVLKLLKCRYY